MTLTETAFSERRVSCAEAQETQELKNSNKYHYHTTFNIAFICISILADVVLSITLTFLQNKEWRPVIAEFLIKHNSETPITVFVDTYRASLGESAYCYSVLNRLCNNPYTLCMTLLCIYLFLGSPTNIIGLVILKKDPFKANLVSVISTILSLILLFISSVVSALVEQTPESILLGILCSVNWLLTGIIGTFLMLLTIVSIASALIK